MPRTFLCLCHLRWNFVYQRPQHVLSRMAKHAEVLFFEEPRRMDEAEADAWLEVRTTNEGIRVLTPWLPSDQTQEDDERAQRALLDAYLADTETWDLGLWYYSPMMLAFTDHLDARLIVYDCMDELSAFKDAPPQLTQREARLMRKAHVVFTGGQSLYESKRRFHHNVHAFPSSVDVAHFQKACGRLTEPSDQTPIPRPRLGFYGVLDERFDAALIGSLAAARPDWQFVMLGPVAKIRPEDLPQALNIHYLGQKSYDDLPRYLAGWDVALMPFAINEATRHISPTKTPEYLAAGRPVVSTPITDVVSRYGDSGVVRIAGDVNSFEHAIEASLADAKDRVAFIRRVEAVLAGTSWDNTCAAMLAEVKKCAS
ncbi:glycosyltransferase family 1 protein [Caballeronia sp. LZ062]|uniref:glycosyltransferase family 1 protein n=1 Tax=unclassified Caballeronia TaxID=2646786 RepID=UPI0028640492|nr:MULTISPECIES: glycosyltransferase family 1 protein [unclassified Caballeronia]MDR5857676.1 glycosyltransferase family 1 protein [Caballeronia sp. LZ050]MDR5869226.1 glycosyltransferase family 1 protein [Caballeronia sp. LZ062]